MGCGQKIAYSSYTYPEGVKGALNVFISSCPKEAYAKVFGYAQNYDKLIDGSTVANEIVRAVGSQIHKIIIDWKKREDLIQAQAFLDKLIG